MVPEKHLLRKVHQLIKVLVAISLLFLYSLGSLDPEFFHHLVHRHEAVEFHTPQQESDPCHVALYHPERGTDCGHEAHFAKEDKCLLCHARIINIQAIEICAIPLSPALHEVSYKNFSGQQIREITIQSTGRAPPVS